MSDETPELECTCPPGETPTFEQDLVELLNKHSMERYSGTPDWILGNYLVGVLRQFDCAVQIRANWRGESTEMPALHRLFSEMEEVVSADGTVRFVPGAFDGNNSKKVPLVYYTHGERRVIGEAVLTVNSDEVGIVADMFDEAAGVMFPAIPKGQFSIADTDPLGKGGQ